MQKAVPSVAHGQQNAKKMDDEPNATHVGVDPALDFEAGPESETLFYDMSTHDEPVLVQDANLVLEIDFFDAFWILGPLEEEF